MRSHCTGPGPVHSAGRAIYSDRSPARSGADLFPEYYSILSPAVQLQNSYKSPENSTRAVTFSLTRSIIKGRPPLPQGVMCALSNFREVQSHFSLRLICLSHGNHTGLEVIYYGRSILQLRLRLRGRLRRGGNRSNWGFWILALFFLFVLPPVGILMIVIKLAGGGKKKGRHPYYLQQEQGRMGARTRKWADSPGRCPTPHGAGPQQPSVQDVCQGKEADHRGRRALRRFGFASINSVFGNLWMLPDIAWYLEELVPIFCFFGARGCSCGAACAGRSGCAPSAAIWP